MALRQQDLPQPPVRLVTGRHVTVIDDGVVEDVSASCGMTGAGLYMLLERRVNKEGEWVSTIGDLAAAFGCSVRHIRDTCKTLEDAGFIVREAVLGPRGMNVAIRFILPKHMRTYRAEHTPDVTPEPTPEPSRAAVLESSNQVVTSNGVPPVVPQQKPKATRSKGVKTAIPDGFEPTPEMIAKACDEYGVSREWVVAKTGRFRRWAVSNAATYVNWDAAWMNFMEPKEWEKSQARAPASDPIPLLKPNGSYTTEGLKAKVRELENGGANGPSRGDETVIDSQFRVVG